MSPVKHLGIVGYALVILIALILYVAAMYGVDFLLLVYEPDESRTTLLP